MGSRGQTFGGVFGGLLGGVIGYFAGGPYGAVQGAFLGSSLGMTVGSAVDPPGGRLGDTQYSRQDIYYNTTAHNLPVPVVYGINRVAGNLIWLGNVRVDVEESSGGGKEGGSGGGDKGGSAGTQSAQVFADFAIALSEGEIAALTEVFIGDKRITETSGLNYTVYLGTREQTADPQIIADLGALAPAFRNLAYLRIGGFVGNYPSIPTVNAEVIGRYATTLPVSFTLVSSSAPTVSVASGMLAVHPIGAGGWASVYFSSDDALYFQDYPDAENYVWIELNSLTQVPGRPLPQTIYVEAYSNQQYNSSPFSITSADIETGLDYVFDVTTVYENPATVPIIALTTVGSGVSAVLYLPDNTVVATALETNQTLTLTVDLESYTVPLSGYLQLYSDGLGFSEPVADQGRWPATDYGTFTTYSTFAYETHYTWGNPATIVEDILTNPRYGCAINSVRIDRASFTAAYSYCTGLVPYRTAAGGVGYEPRFCLDYVMDAQAQVLDHLRAMLATCGGFLTWSQGVVKMQIEQPGATVTQSFGMHEIAADSFRWKRQSYRERPNVVRIEYVEPGALNASGADARVSDSQASLVDPYWGSQQLVDLIRRQGDSVVPGLYYKTEYKVYRQDFVEACDVWDIDRTGERRDRIFNLTGIKRRTQAQRMAYYYLHKAIFCSHACAFRVGAGALKAEVGDVIAVSHDIPRWQGKLFRIAELQEAENDEIVLGCLEHSEAVYEDLSPDTPHGQNTLYGLASGQGGQPVNVARLSAYERPYENTVELVYTRIATSDFFSGTDLYVQRGAGGDWLGIGESVITNAPTAYLTTVIQTLARTTVGVDSSQPITITGVPDGYSGRVLWGNNSVQAEAVASLGTLVLVPPASAPGSGYLQVYTDGASYTTRAAAGRFPATSGVTSWQGGDVFAYRRVPHVVTATQCWIPIDRPRGGWTSGESLRIEREEISYITYTDSMLSGVARGVHGTTAVAHTGIVSLGMVAVYSGDADPPADVTAAFRDPATNVEFFGANSSWLYIGAESKFSAVNLWLARAASHPLGVYGEYSTAAGSWCSITRSYFPAPSDTTSGLRWHGQVFWEPWGDWTPVHETALGGLNIGDTTDRYYIRLMRVASLCVTPPTELELTLTNDTLVVVRKPGAFLYELTLADSGQVLSFKAVSRSIGGLAGDTVAAPIADLDNTT